MPRSILSTLALGALLSGRLLAQETCIPVAERAGHEFGCYITARAELGKLTAEPALYWHLDTFPSAELARKSAVERSTVVQSLGHNWLFTIAGKSWQAGGGQHVATFGPLPLVSASSFSAVYMEGVFTPGMQSRIHRHPGVEVWYTLEGAMCLETPEGSQMQQAGGPAVIARPGLPMILTATGSGVRRSVVLILMDSSQARSTVAHDWKPKGLCKV